MRPSKEKKCYEVGESETLSDGRDSDGSASDQEDKETPPMTLGDLYGSRVLQMGLAGACASFRQQQRQQQQEQEGEGEGGEEQADGNEKQEGETRKKKENGEVDEAEGEKELASMSVEDLLKMSQLIRNSLAASSTGPNARATQHDNGTGGMETLSVIPEEEEEEEEMGPGLEEEEIEEQGGSLYPFSVPTASEVGQGNGQFLSGDTGGSCPPPRASHPLTMISVDEEDLTAAEGGNEDATLAVGLEEIRVLDRVLREREAEARRVRNATRAAAVAAAAAGGARDREEGEGGDGTASSAGANRNARRQGAQQSPSCADGMVAGDVGGESSGLSGWTFNVNQKDFQQRDRDKERRGNEGGGRRERERTRFPKLTGSQSPSAEETRTTAAAPLSPRPPGTSSSSGHPTEQTVNSVGGSSNKGTVTRGKKKKKKAQSGPAVIQERASAIISRLENALRLVDGDGHGEEEEGCEDEESLTRKGMNSRWTKGTQKPDGEEEEEEEAQRNKSQWQSRRQNTFSGFGEELKDASSPPPSIKELQRIDDQLRALVPREDWGKKSLEGGGKKMKEEDGVRSNASRGDALFQRDRDNHQEDGQTEDTLTDAGSLSLSSTACARSEKQTEKDRQRAREQGDPPVLELRAERRRIAEIEGKLASLRCADARRVGPLIAHSLLQERDASSDKKTSGGQPGNAKTKMRRCSSLAPQVVKKLVADAKREMRLKEGGDSAGRGRRKNLPKNGGDRACHEGQNSADEEEGERTSFFVTQATQQNPSESTYEKDVTGLLGADAVFPLHTQKEKEKEGGSTASGEDTGNQRIKLAEQTKTSGPPVQSPLRAALARLSSDQMRAETLLEEAKGVLACVEQLALVCLPDTDAPAKGAESDGDDQGHIRTSRPFPQHVDRISSEEDKDSSHKEREKVPAPERSKTPGRQTEAVKSVSTRKTPSHAVSVKKQQGQSVTRGEPQGRGKEKGPRIVRRAPQKANPQHSSVSSHVSSEEFSLQENSEEHRREKTPEDHSVLVRRATSIPPSRAPTTSESLQSDTKEMTETAEKDKNSSRTRRSHSLSESRQQTSNQTKKKIQPIPPQSDSQKNRHSPRSLFPVPQSSVLKSQAIRPAPPPLKEKDSTSRPPRGRQLLGGAASTSANPHKHQPLHTPQSSLVNRKGVEKNSLGFTRRQSTLSSSASANGLVRGGTQETESTAVPPSTAAGPEGHDHASTMQKNNSKKKSFGTPPQQFRKGVDPVFVLSDDGETFMPKGKVEDLDPDTHRKQTRDAKAAKGSGAQTKSSSVNQRWFRNIDQEGEMRNFVQGRNSLDTHRDKQKHGTSKEEEKEAAHPIHTDAFLKEICITGQQERGRGTLAEAFDDRLSNLQKELSGILCSLDPITMRISAALDKVKAQEAMELEAEKEDVLLTENQEEGEYLNEHSMRIDL
uniref:Uncharacterized protein n=1 Tax=Chromera velia CCMP2878 TaxID=1169474 RepID=A0A0G4FUS4_9ALVE|eukprot:Cvel_3778.t1-p1 / transcript=Cvel_3778.t1 / gene=Cvel_3778 / organism=Chromera_velia_CCMP2878 / gene_product=Serine/arginine repetitive matrix protein 1, putative / transcript_product=Serine/arginine repetitive matrix protein 1, putative / location=Cvel_scaffold158:75467-81793(+) / protein_length=1423 / sequence_SO=supercontig / SO=protein_coding / is_pseudo=false